MLCDRPHSARRALEAAGFAVSITRVVAVEVPDRPGGLADVLELLGSQDINVEYMYCFVRPGADVAVDIFRVGDPDRATEVLNAAGIGTARAVSLYDIDAG
jgi:hypothetical protein